MLATSSSQDHQSSMVLIPLGSQRGSYLATKYDEPCFSRRAIPGFRSSRMSERAFPVSREGARCWRKGRLTGDKKSPEPTLQSGSGPEVGVDSYQACAVLTGPALDSRPEAFAA